MPSRPSDTGLENVPPQQVEVMTSSTCLLKSTSCPAKNWKLDMKHMATRCRVIQGERPFKQIRLTDNRAPNTPLGPVCMNSQDSGPHPSPKLEWGAAYGSFPEDFDPLAQDSPENYVPPEPIFPFFTQEPLDPRAYPGSNQQEQHEAMWGDISSQMAATLQQGILLSRLLGVGDSSDGDCQDMVQEVMDQRGPTALTYIQKRCQAVLDKLTRVETSLAAFACPDEGERLKRDSTTLDAWQLRVQDARKVLVALAHFWGGFEGPCPPLDGPNKGDPRPQTQMEQHCRLYFRSKGWRLFNGNVYIRRTVPSGGQEHLTPHWMRVPRKAQPGEDPHLDGIAALDQAYNKLEVGPLAQDWCSKQGTKVDVLHMLEHNYDLKLPPIERHFYTFRDGLITKPALFCSSPASPSRQDSYTARCFGNCIRSEAASTFCTWYEAVPLRQLSTLAMHPSTAGSGLFKLHSHHHI